MRHLRFQFRSFCPKLTAAHNFIRRNSPTLIIFPFLFSRFPPFLILIHIKQDAHHGLALALEGKHIFSLTTNSWLTWQPLRCALYRGAIPLQLPSKRPSPASLRRLPPRSLALSGLACGSVRSRCWGRCIRPLPIWLPSLSCCWLLDIRIWGPWTGLAWLEVLYCELLTLHHLPACFLCSSFPLFLFSSLYSSLSHVSLLPLTLTFTSLSCTPLIA